MIDMPGNFAVVIHGEFDCVNCFTHHTGRSAFRYYSTRLTEAQLTSGKTAEPLRRCLTMIAEEQKPEAVIVLGTCPVEVIGDRFQQEVEEISAQTGVPMVALHTSGLRMSTQREMLDWCFDTLISLGDGASEGDQVGFIGMPPGGQASEVARVLKQAGISISGHFPEGASMGEWQGLGRSSRSFVSDLAIFPKVVERLRARGQTLIETPLPYGLAASQRFYTTIDKALSLDGALLSSLTDESQRAQQAINKFRSQHGGKRMALTLRMRNTYRSDVVAQDGLGQLEAYQELGFDVTLLVQGAPDPDVVEAYGVLLRDRGLTLPFEIFPGPFFLQECLERGAYDLACVADHGLKSARSAGIPAFDSVAMSPYIGAVPRSLARLNALLEHR